MDKSLICVDNCVAVKWVTQDDEQNWEKARHLLAAWRQGGVKLIAPPVFDTELRYVLGKKFKDRSTEPSGYFEALYKIRSLVEIRTHPDIECVAAAFGRYLKPIDSQDTTYMALAALNDCELWTHDNKWKDNEPEYKKLSEIFPFIRLLQDAEYPPNLLVPQFELQETSAVAVQQLKADMLLTKLNPQHPRKTPDALILMPGISGDGSNGTPDYIDREHTTALVDEEKHTIG